MIRRGFASLTSVLSLADTIPKITIPAEVVQVFNRKVKRRQRNIAASQEEFDTYRYVRDEFGARVADRVYDLTGFHEICVDLGCGAGHISPHLIKENVGTIIQSDMSEVMVHRSRGAPEDEMLTHRLVADEELVPFREGSVDLILSSLAAHWINDLPGWFRRCFSVLRPDGCMIGSILAGETLHELRVSLQLAEMERLGGIGAHISPFVEAQDIGALMSRAGFGMITLDADEMQVGYPNMFALLYDLQGMAESGSTSRRPTSLRKEVLIAADCIYRALYAKLDRFPASFQCVSFIGWRPGPNMPKAAKRGSQSASFKDISQIITE